ncbi:MAG: exosome complex RNA-binding protein Rrp4 [archaeon]|nr:exosome complex RNA-binding protein Rrp4 [archaeon]
MYKVVVPGDFLSEEANRAGEGTYVADGKVYAMKYGIMDDKEEIKVVALSGKYVPSRGDIVIGKIVEISFPYWIVDIASPYEARLHMSELAKGEERRIEFGSMNRYLDSGDLIVAKVLSVDALMRVDLTLKDEFKIGGRGRLIEISHTKVPRVIGRSGSMIKMLKEKCNCFIFIAKNGRIWIKGSEDEMNLASQVVLMIANEAHTSGLTDRVADFLDSFKKRRG